MMDDDIRQREKAKRIINERLSQISEKQLSSLFAEVNKSSTTTARINEIVREISEYIGAMTLPVAVNYLYRARYWSDQLDYPKHISELLEPKPKITSQGRCNIEGKPVLYLSVHPYALISECHFTQGDIFAMAQFDRFLKSEDLSCLMLGIDPHQEFEERPELANMYQAKKSFYGGNFKKYVFIESQLHKQFVRDDDQRGITYKFTANLCEHYFESYSNIDAIVYPSIATKGSFTNFAIRPGKYSKTYVDKKVGLFEVLTNGNYRQIDGATIGKNGELDWSSTAEIDMPKPASIRAVDPNDPRIYKAPWRK